jgi:hypothetical protein
MELTDLSREDLIIVSTMLVNGLTIEEVEKKFIPNTMQNIVETIHGLACRMPHHQADYNRCTFYEETSYESGCKLKWLGIALKIKEDYEVTDTELLKTIGYAYKIEGLIKQLTINQSTVVESILRDLLLLTCAIPTDLPIDSPEH